MLSVHATKCLVKAESVWYLLSRDGATTTEISDMTIVENDSASIDQVRVRILPDGRMTRKDAAEYLGRKPKTLAWWELQGIGPQSVKVGGRRFYFKESLDAFIRGQAA